MLEHKILKFKAAGLSQRQSECLHYLCRGATAKIIAQQLHISYRTVEAHVASIKTRFNCQNRYEMIEKAIQLGEQS